MPSLQGFDPRRIPSIFKRRLHTKVRDVILFLHAVLALKMAFVFRDSPCLEQGVVIEYAQEAAFSKIDVNY